MATRQPRYSKEEFARRGDEIYERDIKPKMRAEDDGKFVAIDIESGQYAIHQDDYTATELLLQKCPDPQMWLVRVGQKAAHRIGGGWSKGGMA